MRCHSVRVLYSLLPFSFQLMLVASERRVKTVPFGVDRLSASWPRNPMRVMRFLQNMCVVFLSALICWGDPEQRGPLSRQAKTVFRRVRSRLFALLQKGEPAI